VIRFAKEERANQPAQSRLLADDCPDMVKAVGRLLALECEIVGSLEDGSTLFVSKLTSGDLLATIKRLCVDRG
jgi:hypothetical protein